MNPNTTVLPSLTRPTGGSTGTLTRAHADLINPARRFTFYLVLVFVFLRISMLHELVSAKLGFNSYILALVGTPALLGVILTGGIRRTLRLRASWYWLAFFAWIILAIPFSTWRGGSFNLVATYGRTELSVLFMLAGIPLQWSECRSTLYAMALGALAAVAAGRLFMVENYGGERMSLAFGTMSNSNDFAAHLLIALPFLLFVLLSSSTNSLFRLTSGLALLYGIFLVLDTASRGALVALGVAAVYIFWRGSMRIRVAMLIGIPVLSVVSLAVLPKYVLARLGTFATSGTSAESLEAAESAQSRRYVFETSVRYTLENPLVGVGPGQFATREGNNERTIGTHGYWHQTHNILTQVSSECGIPALIFFVGAIGATWWLIYRVQKQAQSFDLQEISVAAFCLGLALVSFFAASLFLNLAYRFYLPALTGLAIALYSATAQQIQALKATKPASPATPSPSVPAPVVSPARRYRFGRAR